MDAKRYAPIDDQSQRRNPHHQACLHVNRMAQAPYRFVNQEHRREREQHRVHKCGENSRAVVAVGLLGRRRPQGPARGKPGNDQGGNIGEVMNGIADQGYRMSGIAGRKLREHQNKRANNRRTQNARGTAGQAMIVRMCAVVAPAVGM